MVLYGKGHHDDRKTKKKKFDTTFPNVVATISYKRHMSLGHLAWNQKMNDCTFLQE